MRYFIYTIITIICMVQSVPSQTTFLGDDTIQHYVGELYGGGIIFYVDKTGKHGLICSMSDIIGNKSSVSSSDRSQLQFVVLSKNETKIYHTLSVDNALNASILCDGYTNSNLGTGIFSDWFLPDINQLQIMYWVKSEINKAIKAYDKNSKGLLYSALYWSSSKSSDDRFPENFLLDFNGGQRVSILKPMPLENYYVRAVRTF